MGNLPLVISYRNLNPQPVIIPHHRVRDYLTGALRKSEIFDLNYRVGSRLSDVLAIEFDRYSSDELMEILEQRADAALANDAVKTEQLEAIVERAEGDARLVINALRNAA